MPRQIGISVANNFTGGLITEASVLQFPPNACTETLDCEHTLTGSVNRRLGWDYEPNHSIKQIDRTDGVINSYLWKDVAGNGNVTISVVQIGGHLYFYDASTNDPISSKPFSSSVDLTDFQVSGSPDVGTQECQITAGNGKLIVVHPYCEAFTITFNQDDSTFSTTQINIDIRDFEGLSDGLETTDRPTVSFSGMSTAHHYNLLNQGWNDTNLHTWDGSRTDMPSNADVMSYFVSPDSNGVNKFDITKVDQETDFIGNTPAAKGHYVLNVFNKDRGTASGLVIDPETTGYQRASCVAFYTGRVFYSGINYVGLNSNIYFSQIIDSDDQFGACYQRNDPTSDKLFDLLPNDGGVITIQEAGTIIKMLSVPGGLMVFASNGIWSIAGSTGLGFTASDYSVTKLSSVPALTSTSFIDLQGIPIWWNLESIYRLDAGPQGFQVTSLTNTTIKTFYRDIPSSEKRNVRGFYNPVTNIVQWLYRSTESSDINEYYNFDRILNFNTLTNSFYIWTIPDAGYNIHSILVVENRGGDVSLEDVQDNAGNDVYDNAGNIVQYWDIGNSIVVPKFKYVMSYNDGTNDQFTYAEVRQDTYTDWHEDAVDQDYLSTFTTGYAIDGKAILRFQNNYVNIFADNNSKYTIKGLWDFANSSSTHKWSNAQTVDTTNNSTFDNISKRIKIRGDGNALQININSVENNPFNIKGWSTFVTTNGTI